MSFEAAGDDPLEEFRENVAQFAQSVIAPHAEDVDRTNDFPKSANLWKEMGEFGLLGTLENPVCLLMSSHNPPGPHAELALLCSAAGITAPEEYGGLNMGYRAHCIAMEVRWSNRFDHLQQARSQ